MTNSDPSSEAVENEGLEPARPEDDAAAARKKLKKRLRLLALALFFLSTLVIAKLTGVADELDRETIRAFMESAGVLGFFGFLVIFAVGELVHIPGMVFVTAASIAYGEALGIAAGYVGALLSVTVSFMVVRTIGGQPLGDVKRPIVVRILSRLDTHPIRTVALLRLLFWLAPPLNYALAMSKIRFRDYFVGSALGLLPPIAIVVLAFDWIMTLPFFRWLTGW